jgi:hypothetical protein
VSSGLYRPQGVAVDGSGNVYIADDFNSAVKEWSASTQQVTTLASAGLLRPNAVAVDGARNVYIADDGNFGMYVLPYAFVGPASLTEPASAGTDSLLPVLPSTQSLTGVYAPTSDSSWLTIGTIADGVVSFSFAANTSATRMAHISILGQQITVVQNGAQNGSTAQTIAFGPLADQPLSSAPFALTATASSGLPVSFSSQTTGVCAVSGSLATLVAVGTCTIQATQAGNSTYAAAAPVCQSFQVLVAPAISTLNPTSAGTGGAAFTLTVNGSNFVSGAAVDWNGTPLATSFVNAAQLTASVPASLIASTGTASVTVVNPDGGTSAAVTFPIYATALSFVPITPCRVLDSRNAAGPFGGPSITGGSSRDFTIPSGACGIPSTAQAYSLNAAMVPTGHGWITLWPTGQSLPLAASVNSPDGRVKSDGAIVPAGTGGAISVYASVTTQVVLDINGYFVPASGNPTALAFYPVTPCRVADTRNAAGTLGGPYMSGGSTRTFPILAASACGIPSSAQAFSLNLAVVPQAGKLGWLTAWPAGQSQPVVASLNDPPGVVLSNAAIVPAPSDNSGQIDIYVTQDTHVVIDINGYFAPPGTGGLSLYTLQPCRVLDTRKPVGSPPFTGTLPVDVVDSGCGAPSTAQDYVFNATVVPQASHGYLTMWQDGQSKPVAANLNSSDGAVTGNMALVPTANGWIDTYFSGTTYLVLDLFGYFAP